MVAFPRIGHGRAGFGLQGFRLAFGALFGARTRAGAVSMLAIAAALAAGQAAAQSAPAAPGGTVELETIDVKGAGRQTATGPIDGYVGTESAAGTKTSAPLNRTPQAIAIVGARQIRDQAAQTIDEATRYSPGIHSQTFGDDGRNDWFLIRGFTEQNTGYDLDGLQLFSSPSAYATWKLEPWNLERIEIVRGPAASLYGGGDPGGFINAVSKLPTFTNFGVVEAGVNQYGNAYGAFDIGAVGGDKNQWSTRLVSVGRVGGTQTDHVDNDRAFVAPSLTYRPDAATSFTILGQYQHDWTGSLNFLPYQGTVIRAPYGRIPTSLFTGEPSEDKFERDQSMIGYRFETTVNPFLTLRQNMRYGHLTVDERTIYGAGYAAPPTAATAELTRFNFNSKPTADEVEVDNQAEFHFDTWALQHTVLAGIDYKYYTINDVQNFAFGPQYNFNLLNPVYTPTTPTTTPFVNRRETQNQLGFYGQDTIRFDRLTVAGSVREDLVGTSIANRFTAVTSENSPTATSGKIGAIYTFDSGFAPYVSYATSFNPVLGVNTGTGAAFLPETGELQEVGLKYQSPVVPFTAGIALFNLTRNNVEETIDFVNYTQVGAERSRGVELNAQATLAEGLNLIGAFTAYDIAVTKDITPANIGKRPVGVPTQFGSLWLDYTIPNGQFQGLGFGAGMRYTGKSYADTLNTLPVPDFLLGDASIHYERDHWRAALNVSNIADTTYVASCASESACYYGDRRKFTFSVAYRW